MCEAVIQMPVTCWVFSARAAIRMPHLHEPGTRGVCAGSCRGGGWQRPHGMRPDLLAARPPEHGGVQQVGNRTESRGAIGWSEPRRQRIGLRGRRHLGRHTLSEPQYRHLASVK